MTLMVLSTAVAFRVVVPRLADNLPSHSVVYITNAVPVILWGLVLKGIFKILKL